MQAEEAIIGITTVGRERAYVRQRALCTAESPMYGKEDHGCTYLRTMGVRT